MSISVLVINPGSTSTKLALWNEAGPLAEDNIEHAPEEIAGRGILEQVSMRKETVLAFLRRHGDEHPRAVCGRGGPLRPLRGGTYRIDENMLADLRSARYGEHASLLGGLLAAELGERWDVPAYIVDPVCVDELDERARVSGVPGIERFGRGHALSLRAVMRLAALELKRAPADTRFVAAHLGGGISVAAMLGGRIVDVNDALLGMGPFSPYRAGALPLRGVLDLAFAPGTERKALERRLSSASGLFGYLGTGDLRIIETRLDEPEVRTVFDAMVYQIAKEIGAMAATLSFRVDGVIFTGGMSRSEVLIGCLRELVADLAPIFHYPGEREMEALALGGLRVLRGEETALTYPAEAEGGAR